MYYSFHLNPLKGMKYQDLAEFNRIFQLTTILTEYLFLCYYSSHAVVEPGKAWQKPVTQCTFAVLFDVMSYFCSAIESLIVQS